MLPPSPGAALRRPLCDAGFHSIEALVSGTERLARLFAGCATSRTCMHQLEWGSVALGTHHPPPATPRSPQLVFVPCDFEKYKAASEITRGVFHDYDPHFRAGSLDEVRAASVLRACLFLAVSHSAYL